MRFVWCNNMGVRHELPIHHGRLHRPQESFHSLDWTPSPTRCEMKHEMWEESRGNYPRTCCMYTALYWVPLHPSSRVFYHTIQCRRIVTNIQHGKKLAKMIFGHKPTTNTQCTVLPRIVYRGTLIETKRISKTHFSTLMTCHYSWGN